MRTVIQRVLSSSVAVDGKTTGEIGAGLLVLLGIGIADTVEDAVYLAARTAGLRIFADQNGKMNRNVTEAGGSVLVVSQFTLYGDCRKGVRPSYDKAARPEHAQPLYEYFVANLRERGLRVETGVFQASMKVTLVNDGPVTIICDSNPV